MDKVVFAIICLLLYFYTVTCVFFTVEIAKLKGRRKRWGWLGFLLGILGIVLVSFLPNAKGVEGETNPVKAVWNRLTALISPVAAWILVGGIVVVLGGTLLGTRLTTFLDNRAHEKELSQSSGKEEVLSPAKVKGTVTGIFCGTDSNFAVTESGDLYGWGLVGLEPMDESGKLRQNVKKICRSGETYYLLEKDGTLYGMGDNRNSLIPGQKDREVKNFVKIEEDVADMALSGTVGAILKTSGNLYVVGVNTYGQLGRAVEKTEQIGDKLADQVQKVVVTGRSLYYLKKDGTVFGVGNNAYGQFGLGHKDAQGAPVKLAEGCQDLAAGEDFLLVLKKDGTIWSAGNNCYGQLGREIGDEKPAEGATEEDKKKLKKPAEVLGQVLAVEKAEGIDASGGTAVAWAEKELYGWGLNHLGQLGKGENNLLKVEKIYKGTTHVALGKNCVLLVTEDGDLLGAGDRQYDQLGTRHGEGFRQLAEVKEGKN